LGFDELLEQKDLVIALEWADKVKSILPQCRINIAIKHKTNQTREIKIKSAIKAIKLDL